MTMDARITPVEGTQWSPVARPTPHQAAAKKNEIAVRYRWCQRRKWNGAYDRARHRLAELSRLAKHRRRLGRSDVEFDKLLGELQAYPRKWSAQSLGHETKLTWDERCELGIRTIRPDMTDQEFRAAQAARKRERARERQRRRRRELKRASVAKLNLSRAKLWEHAGVSRSTWYRRKRCSASA